jgi:glycosyltransferase involved in cell wall biosynthesis
MTTELGARVSVVVPVYNERATIEEILRRVQMVELDKEILIIDDSSTDGTREFLANLAGCRNSVSASPALPQSHAGLWADNIRVLFQDRSQGKGAALRRGFREAQGEIVIIQDDDLE